MKERGMIFNGEMVRAILDGRKRQTRRIMRVQPEPSKSRPGDFWFPSKKLESMVHVSDLVPGNSPIADCHLFFQEHCCPFGGVGDRIWVRETFQGPLIPEDELSEFLGENPDKFESPSYCEYAADGGPRPEYVDADDNTRHGWRPAIHMPRWASRILLEITGVRVERLHAADESDLLDELGDMLEDCDSVAGKAFNHAEHYAIAGVPVGMCPEMHGFKAWWDKVNGAGSFDSNPWVWVIEFKRIEGDDHATD